MRCEACGQSWPDVMRYCGGCGRPLGAPPAGLTTERKLVTVLFCDLVGATARADGADPEDVQVWLAAYHGLLRTVLDGHDATVEKFIGDAVMAVFGAPVAHGDDAERAVRAGLAILAAIDRANDASSGPALAVRIGLATGEVLVSLAARPDLGESLIAGDVVNVAARLQASAEPGTVVVAERTRSLTAAQVAYAELAPAVLKGKAAPLARWQATGMHEVPAGEAGARSATRFVGRSAELAVLQAAYRRASTRPGLELVLVIGEPGAGKSRLAAEFFGWIDQRSEPVCWRQGRCLPYGDDVVFYPLAEIVRAEAGILDSDDQQTVRDKLTRTVAGLTGFGEPDRPWLTAGLAPLAGMASEAGASRRDRFAAWCQFLQALAEKSPLVLVVEDAHWADADLLAFLGYFAERTADVPVVVVLTARPDLMRRSTDLRADGGAFTRLMLEPLDDDDTAALIADLLDAQLEARFEARLLQQVGGNPLFAEQVIHLLTEQGAVHRRGRVAELAATADLPMPDTLSGLISARLDALPPQQKALLGAAAVIGRVFWSGALAAVAELPEQEVRGALRDLATSGFVAMLPRSSIADQAEYRFTHALVRDAAYAALPRAVRVTRHLAAAGWLEARSAEHRADVAQLVGYHAVTALELAEARGDSATAARLRPATARRLATAGARAKALDAAAAERHYAKAVSLFDPGDPERVGALCEWGHASVGVGKTEQGQRALEEALALAREHDDTRHAGLALLWLGSEIAGRHNDLAEEERLTESAVALLETLGPSEELAMAYHYMAFIRVYQARPVQALELCRRVLELVPSDSNWRVLALAWRAQARAMLGDPDCLDDARESIRLARHYGLIELSNALMQASDGLWRAEGPAPALAAAQESRALHARRGSSSEAFSVTCGIAYMLDLGRWDEALAMASEWRQRIYAVGHAVYLEPYCATAFCWREAVAEAHRLLDPVLADAREYAIEQLVHTLTAAVTLSAAEGDTAQVLRLVEEYERVLAPAAPASWHWGGCYLADFVRACLTVGEVDKAQRIARDAAPPAQWRQRLETQSAMAAIAEATGDPVAEQLYARAEAGWHKYGHALEHGLALLGLGRCRRQAGNPQAAAALLAARAVFAELGAVRPVAEADSWLNRRG